MLALKQSNREELDCYIGPIVFRLFDRRENGNRQRVRERDREREKIRGKDSLSLKEEMTARARCIERIFLASEI